MRWLMSFTVITAVLLVYAACGEDRSPTGTDDGSGEQEEIILQGRLLFEPSAQEPLGFSFRINIHITGADTDTTFDTHYGIQFYSFRVPAGTYSITATIGEPYSAEYTVVPTSRTVTGASGFMEVDPFLILSKAVYQSYEANDLGVIYGDVSLSDWGMGVTTTTLATLDGTVVSTTPLTSFSFFSIPHGQYRITPANNYFVFDPPDSTVTLDGFFGTADFTGEYTGPARFTISCRILSNVHQYVGQLSARLVSDSNVFASAHTDEGGGYVVTRPLIPGEYTVEITCSKPRTGGRDEFENERFNTFVSDSDIDLGEFTLNYIGYMYYTVNGTITDTSGSGIEGVTVTLRNDHVAPVYGTTTTTTGVDGVFTFSGSNFSTHGDIDMTVTATKPGWAFDPPSYTLIHALDPSLATTVFTTPFTGIPVIMADYFPLVTGATWTFSHTADGVPSGTITVEAGASFSAGGYQWVPLSGYMFGGFSGYRAQGAGMYAWNGQQATWVALDLATWNIGQINGISAKGERLAPEDVTVPAGTFVDCRVIRITVPPDSPSAEVTTYWLAENVGPVKVEFTAISGGTVIQRITDELVSYQAP